MKVVYDSVAENDRDKRAAILDCHASGNMVSFEIPNAWERTTSPVSVKYDATPPLRRLV
jgi:hypothetical protein